MPRREPERWLAPTRAATADGSAGGWTTIGTACDRSTVRRGGSMPGVTRSANTTFETSSSRLNDGA